jgi:hypothetical protein
MQIDKSKENLNILMSSDFNKGEFNVNELTWMLLDFRYFYRLKDAKYNSLKYKIDELKDYRDKYNLLIKEHESDLLDKDIIYDEMVNRKLSFKERILGELKPKNNRKIKFKFWKK